MPLPVGEFIHFPAEAADRDRSKPCPSRGSGRAMDGRHKRRTTGAGFAASRHEDRSSDLRQYAPAAERNTGPICEILGRYLPAAGTILEIGSGTGQHVIAFAAAHPELCWRPSDSDPAARASIAAWTAAADLANVCAPLDLDVTPEDWPSALDRPPQGMVCINLLHIAPWAACTGLWRAPAGCSRRARRSISMGRSSRAARTRRPVTPSSIVTCACATSERGWPCANACGSACSPAIRGCPI
jgi:Protein of unknown function (DUF938)